MANDAARDNGFGTAPMQQTNTQTPPDYLDHTHREETTKFNVFHVKLQFRADPPTENNQKPITTKLFHLVSHIVSHHSHVVLKTASGQELDLKTPFATDAIAKTATQLTQNESARGRNITMIMTIETTHRQLNKIKYPMLAWLQKENYWFERHLFKTTQIDICHLGFIVGKCPTDTHRATFQQMINDKIAALMMGQATDVYYREKIYNYDGAPRDIPSVRVLFQKPAWPMRGPPVVSTKALGIDCLREERAALLDLLPQVFPSDGLAVFVPSSLPHDNTIPDATDKFMDMLHAQNVYLANHRSIQLAGISEEDMHRLNLNATIGTIANQLLAQPFILAIERTPATTMIGKWLVITTSAEFDQATDYLDKNLPDLLEALENPKRFMTFPRPRRIKPSQVPMTYINTITLAAKTTASNHTGPLAHPPGTNAWQGGPPRPISRHDNENASAVTKTSLTSETISSKMDDFIEKQEQAMTRMQAALTLMSNSQANSKTALLQEIDSKLHAQESATNSKIDRLTSSFEATLAKFDEQAAKISKYETVCEKLSQAATQLANTQDQVMNSVMERVGPVIDQQIDRALRSQMHPLMHGMHQVHPTIFERPPSPPMYPGSYGHPSHAAGPFPHPTQYPAQGLFPPPARFNPAPYHQQPMMHLPLHQMSLSDQPMTSSHTGKHARTPTHSPIIHKKLANQSTPTSVSQGDLMQFDETADQFDETADQDPHKGLPPDLQ
jgi:hypothetical protein